MMTIIRDTKEKIGWEFSNMVSSSLKTGDYSLLGLEDKVSIERKKTTAELAQNITKPRFIRELERLQEFAHPYVICEFDMEKLHSFPNGSGIPFFKLKYVRISSAYLVKKILELQERFPKIQWLFCEDRNTAQANALQILQEIYEVYK